MHRLSTQTSWRRSSDSRRLLDLSSDSASSSSTLNNRVALLTCLTGLLLVSLNEIVTVPDENEDQDEEAEENS